MNKKNTKKNNATNFLINIKQSRLLHNKKGIFGGVMQSIGNFFQGIMHLLPKPLLFLIFLAIILLLAQLLTYIFNIFGIYCTSGDIPVTIDFNPLKSAELIGEIPQAEDLGKEIIDPNTIQDTVIECSHQTTGEYTIIYSNGTKINSSTTRWLYNDAGCIECPISAKIDFHDSLSTPEKWCLTNAYRKEEKDKNTLEKWFCGARFMGRCEPPPHYYWQVSTGNYVCEDQTCEGITAGNYWDNILQKNGAKPLYADAYGETRSIAHDKILSIQCKDVRPKLTLFGIDLFNLQYWLLIMLIMIMIWALKTWL